MKEIDQIIELSNDPKKDARIKRWEIYQKLRLKSLTALFERSGGILDDLLRIGELEFKGGVCWKCGIQWIEHIVDSNNKYGKYYTPNCECFIKCPNCLTYLYDLQILYEKVEECHNCGFKLWNNKINRPRFGRDYEEFFNSLTEAEKWKERMK